jgi:nucleoside diphosphate kinase
MSSPPTERAFVMLKPDAVQRGLVSTIIDRLERKGFQLVAMKMVQADRNTLEQHYQGWASTVTLVKVAKEFLYPRRYIIKIKTYLCIKWYF